MAKVPQSGLAADNPARPLLLAGISYWGRTTGAGSAAGNSLVDSLCSTIGLQPRYVNQGIRLINGDAGGQVGYIVAHNLATGEMTVADSFSDYNGAVYQVPANVDFVIGAVGAVGGEMDEKVIALVQLDRYGADKYFWGEQSSKHVNADNIWTDAGIVQPAGENYTKLYSRTAFRYPIIVGRMTWATLVGAPTIQCFFGLENQNAALVGLACFGQRYHTGADHLELRSGSGADTAWFQDITTLAPVDWLTANHKYGIRTFRNGAEFWIDDALVGVVVTNLSSIFSKQLGNYGFANNPVEDGLWAASPVMSAFLAIEVGSEAHTFPVSKRYFTITEGDPDYRRAYPILNEATIIAGGTTVLADCMPIPVDKILDLTVECTYNALAGAGGSLEIFTSNDSITWDTEPVEAARVLVFAVGETIRETFTPSDAAQRARFLKALVENLDAGQAITNAEIIATVGG